MNAVVPIAPWPLWRVLSAGVLLGIAYTLSPMTVLMLPCLVLVVHLTGRALGDREREWLYALMFVAIVARLAVIAGLFLSADADQPFATFFGDEEMFKFRSIWLRNIGLGVPISAADFIYAADEVGKSSYLSILAFLAAAVGDMPYGIHLFNTVLYFGGVCLIYRAVRPSYGRLVALGGLTILLLLPSLFIWSISALKEPLYTLLAALELWCALYIARGRRWYWRIAALGAVVVLGVLLEGLRKGGLLVAGIGTIAGIAGAIAAKRPRLAIAALVLAPIIAVAALRVPPVQDRAIGVVKEAALYHVGHVYTPGYSYRTLDSWYYIDPADIHRVMSGGDAVKYVLMAMVEYVVQPLPWAIETRSTLAFIPEHMIWLVLIALLPLGLIAGLRHDAVLTAVLAGHGFAVMLIVALTSGNIGTLIRHRGLVLPYIVWLSLLGGYHLMLRMAPASVIPRLSDQSTAHAIR